VLKRSISRTIEKELNGRERQKRKKRMHASKGAQLDENKSHNRCKRDSAKKHKKGSKDSIVENSRAAKYLTREGGNNTLSLIWRRKESLYSEIK